MAGICCLGASTRGSWADQSGVRRKRRRCVAGNSEALDGSDARVDQMSPGDELAVYDGVWRWLAVINEIGFGHCLYLWCPL